MSSIPRPSPEARFASLEKASRSLSQEVQALNKTLRIVAELETEQREQSRRQDEAELAIAKAKEEVDVRDSRLKRTFGMVALSLMIILPVASILVYLLLIQHVDHLLVSQRKGFYASCLTRNQATRDNIIRERLLSEVEHNAAVKRIHLKSAESMSANVVDCSVYKRK